MVDTQKSTARAGVLKGMDAIEAFSGFNRVILLRMKKEYPLMPMRRLGHIYLADPDRLRQFLKDYAAGDTEKYLGPDRGAGPESAPSEPGAGDNAQGDDSDPSTGEGGKGDGDAPAGQDEPDAGDGKGKKSKQGASR